MKKIISFIVFLLFTISTPSFSKSQKDIDKFLETLDLDIQQQKFEKLTNKPETYRVYIDDEIGEPNTYREIFELLNKVTNKDTVIFKINTNGGLVQTTLAIINAIKSCNAMTVAEIQTAYSAGGIIAMACKKQIVMPYATMMIHSIQLGASGDLNMIQEELKCFKKLNDDIITNSFKNFLTKKELEYVLKGGVIWLNDEEIRNRLKK
jgi:ATP-dependent protease ClpP protease subunit